MTKSFLISLFLLLAGLGLQAQEAAPLWWGYWTSSQGLSPSVTLGDGVYTCAIRLTAQACPRLVGSKLHGVRLYVADRAGVAGLSAWASQRQFTATADLTTKDVPMAQLADYGHDAEPIEVRFDEPLSILPKGNAYGSVYVGFTITVAAGQACRLMASADGGGRQNSCIINWKGYEQTYGALALQVLVSNDDLPAYGVEPLPAGTTIALAGSDSRLPLRFANVGTQAVGSFQYTVTMGGQSQVFTAHLDTLLSELEGVATVSPSFPLPQQPSLHQCRVEVTQVNGQPNAALVTAAANPCLLLSQLPLRRSVMEEYTGTWCPNCPRGDVAMRLLDELFADRFVGISVHNDDPMAIADYDGSVVKRKFVDGYPSCVIDRRTACDPYLGLDMTVRAFQTDRLLRQALAEPTVADLTLTAQWDDAQAEVACDAATTFRYSADEAPYALAFVLTADSLAGEGSDWLQVNTYAGATDWDEPMRPFCEGERRVRMAYDHVAIAVAGIDNGLPGSIALPIVADAEQHFVRRFSMRGNALVQDKERLRAVALLIDTTTGQVANAVAAAVQAGAADGIRRVPVSPPQAEAWVGLDGHRTACPRRGLYILRQADGTTKKQIF